MLYAETKEIPKCRPLTIDELHILEELIRDNIEYKCDHEGNDYNDDYILDLKRLYNHITKMIKYTPQTGIGRYKTTKHNIRRQSNIIIDLL